MKKRLSIFVEGDTDKLFFGLLISFLFRNANKRQWDSSRLNVVSLDGICNADGIIKSTLSDLPDREKYEDTATLIYDTDAFEYQKKPPISLKRVERLARENGCDFFSIPIEHNVEDMIVFSLSEIISYLKIPSDYKIPKNIDGLALLKTLHKEAGQFYIKGNRCEGLLKCLDYSSISKKYCKDLRPLCEYFELECEYNLCRIKKKKVKV